MALTYAQVYAVAHNNDNVARVEVAIVKAAIDIASENVNTANHTNRALFAQRVLHDPARWAAIMATGVAVDATVQTTPSDANLYNAVAAMWNAYAGAAT